MNKQSVSIPFISVLSMSQKPQQPRLFIMPGEYTFIYDYPLSKPVMVKRHLDSTTGAMDIMWFASKDYENIYKNPEEYGIWGHHISDLGFESIHIDGNQITFSIGS